MTSAKIGQRWRRGELIVEVVGFKLDYVVVKTAQPCAGYNRGAELSFDNYKFGTKQDSLCFDYLEGQDKPGVGDV